MSSHSPEFQRAKAYLDDTHKEFSENMKEWSAVPGGVLAGPTIDLDISKKPKLIIYRFEMLTWAEVKNRMKLLRSRKYKFKSIDMFAEQHGDNCFNLIVEYTV